MTSVPVVTRVFLGVAMRLEQQVTVTLSLPSVSARRGWRGGLVTSVRRDTGSLLAAVRRVGATRWEPSIATKKRVFVPA